MKKRSSLIVCMALLSASCVSAQASGKRETILKPLLKQVAGMFSASDSKSAQAFAEALGNRFLADFDKRLECSECYREKVLKECEVFPEGDIYSFAIPAFAYANLAVTTPDMKAHALKQIATLIDLAVPVVIENTEPPQKDLLQLSSYQDEATYLGTLYLMLAHYAFIGGDSRYEALHAHLADVLYQAMVNSEGESLHSYPEYTWHFDTLFVLTALYLDDLRQGTNRAEEHIERHLDWKQQHATHQPSGLPVAFQGSLPRGCDLSMQIGLWAHMHPETARDLYQKYIEAHWVDHGFIAGFSEWPAGERGTGTAFGDFDSGPLIFDIGLTATGIGLVTTRAMQDWERFEILTSELQMVTPIIQALAGMEPDNEARQWFGMYVPLDPSYFTGFLYGDAMMFYALTWTPFDESEK